MRRRLVLRTIRMRLPSTAFASMLLLSFCFLLGGFSAMAYSGVCDDASRSVLSEYLFDYCLLFDQNMISISFLECFRLYFWSVSLAFLFGFSSLGLCAIPLISGVFGFTSFYTVFCFAIVFGRSGVLLAAALVFVRLLFTVPCYFSVASAAWRYSRRLSSLVFGGGKRTEPVHYPVGYFILFICCVIILFLGICLERYITPTLFRAAVDRLGIINLKGGTL